MQATKRGLRHDDLVLIDSRNAESDEHQVLVVESPHIMGPFAVDDNPVAQRYEIVARLALPAKDAEVTPTVSLGHEGRGTFLDVQWHTDAQGEARGVWERSVSIIVPRQFAVKGFKVVGDAPLHERTAGR
jgi:hypothetical protein